MFKRHDVHLTNNPTCEKAIENLTLEDFRYYDVDGFELNLAEQKYYAAMNHPIEHKILNHTCWQEPWFELLGSENLFLDHCMFLCRAGYSGKALEQLESLKSPLANLLIRTKVKWGLDFDLCAFRDNNLFEVLHIEIDSRNYDYFCQRFIHFDYIVRHTDWEDAADKIWKSKDQWQHLTGFEQNDWKANYLLGWTKAEYTEKAI